MLAWQPFSGTERNRPADFGEQPLPVMSQDGMALTTQAEAYAVQPSVSPPNPSGNLRLNPCKPGGFPEMHLTTSHKSVAIPPTSEEVGFLATGDRDKYAIRSAINACRSSLISHLSWRPWPGRDSVSINQAFCQRNGRINGN